MITTILLQFMITSGDSTLFETGKSLSFHRHLSKFVLEIVETNFNLDMPVATQTPELWHGKHQSTDHENISSFGDILLETISSAPVISYFTLGLIKDFQKREFNEIKPGSYIFVVSAKNHLIAIDMFLRTRYNARNRAANVLVVTLESLQMPDEHIITISDSMNNAWRAATLTNVVVIVPKKKL